MTFIVRVTGAFFALMVTFIIGVLVFNSPMLNAAEADAKTTYTVVSMTLIDDGRYAFSVTPRIYDCNNLLIPVEQEIGAIPMALSSMENNFRMIIITTPDCKLGHMSMSK